MRKLREWWKKNPAAGMGALRLTYDRSEFSKINIGPVSWTQTQSLVTANPAEKGLPGWSKSSSGRCRFQQWLRQPTVGSGVCAVPDLHYHMAGENLLKIPILTSRKAFLLQFSCLT